MPTAADLAIRSLSPREQRNAQRLLGRMKRAVDIEHTVTRIADRDYPWTRVGDPERLLETALKNHEDGTVQKDPFWAATWRAAIGLDRFLASYPGLTDLPVLELGGGSGRAGIAAALRGARVCITDASSMALLICRYNARFVSERVHVRYLEWSSAAELPHKYPLILGSDIVYNPNLYSILEPCLRQSLSENGTVLLSEPQRHTGDRFETWIRAAGWRCTSSFVDLEDGERAIRIFQCRLP